MKVLSNKKLAARMGIITSVITLFGMLLLWGVVSVNAASVVRRDITNQMTDAVESRAAIISHCQAQTKGFLIFFSELSEKMSFPILLC